MDIFFLVSVSFNKSLSVNVYIAIWKTNAINRQWYSAFSFPIENRRTLSEQSRHDAIKLIQNVRSPHREGSWWSPPPNLQPTIHPSPALLPERICLAIFFVLSIYFISLIISILFSISIDSRTLSLSGIVLFIDISFSYFIWNVFIQGRCWLESSVLAWTDRGTVLVGPFNWQLLSDAGFWLSVVGCRFFLLPMLFYCVHYPFSGRWQL